MKVLTGVEIENLKGTPLTINGKENGEKATVGWACVEALLATYEDEKNLGGEEKIKRHKIAVKIHGKPEVDLKAEEITKIKNLVGKAFGPLIVGRVFEILDPEPVDEKIVADPVNKP